MSLPDRVKYPHVEAQTIKDSIEDWTRRADELAEAGDLAALGDGLGRLRGLRQALGDLERHVEDSVAALMPSKQVEIDGAVLIRHSGNKYKDWQREPLLDHLWTASFADENGVLDPVGQSARFLATVKEVFRVEPRVTPLRERVTQLDEWCKQEKGRPTVQIVKGGDGDATR